MEEVTGKYLDALIGEEFYELVADERAHFFKVEGIHDLALHYASIATGQYMPWFLRMENMLPRLLNPDTGVGKEIDTTSLNLLQGYRTITSLINKGLLSAGEQQAFTHFYQEIIKSAFEAPVPVTAREQSLYDSLTRSNPPAGVVTTDPNLVIFPALAVLNEPVQSESFKAYRLVLSDNSPSNMNAVLVFDDAMTSDLSHAMFSAHLRQLAGMGAEGSFVAKKYTVVAQPLSTSYMVSGEVLSGDPLLRVSLLIPKEDDGSAVRRTEPVIMGTY